MLFYIDVVLYKKAIYDGICSYMYSKGDCNAGYNVLVSL